jgi:plastocyanin domain-containing protein
MKLIILAASVLFSAQIVTTRAATNQVVELRVTEKGFEPERLIVKPDVPVTLKVTRITDTTCAKQIKISSRNIKKDLPLNKTVNIELGKLEKGEVSFGCGMDMMTGHIVVQ